MVRRGNESTQWHAAPPSPSEILLRQLTAGLLIVALYTMLNPYTPFTWALDIDGTGLLDRFLGLPIVFGALYFQWRIASVSMPLIITIPVIEYSTVYRHTMYWQSAFLEFAILVSLGLTGNEMLRRIVVTGILLALWAVGWPATPAWIKQEAWERLKWIWMWMMVDEARSVTWGHRRRRW